MGTGFPAEDAQNDFARARRSRMLADLARRLRFEPDDVGYILPFEEVVEALGRVSEHDLGLQTIALDSIVGTVDRTKEFDRAFRPTSPRLRARWQRIAEAQRRGESFPPISVYRIGELHFVRDGHHRVSVARSLGPRRHRRLRDRGPDARRPGPRRARLRPAGQGPRAAVPRARPARRPSAAARSGSSDPWDYGSLAEGVEAWGFRAMQGHRAFMDRAEVARLWFDEDYKPVTEMLDEADLVERGETETDAYMRDRDRALPAAAHARLVRRGARAPALRRARRKRRTRMPPKRRHSKRPPY